MKSIEKELKNHKSAVPREEKVLAAIEASKKAFCEGEENRSVSYLEFLFEQSAYIRKYWWVMQAAILMVLWWILCTTKSSYMVWRSMGILAPLFGVMILPELWKNRTCGSMEIEGAAYFSLRQIYAARMLVLGLADTLLLSVFFVSASVVLKIALWDLMVQFFLPFLVTVCICFRTLLSRGSEYSAAAFCLMWSAIWGLVISKEPVYQAVAEPVWGLCLMASCLYLCWSVRRTLKLCETYWEVNPSC